MEIMIVIIVIAVLASVAGPLVGSITDKGRASATKSKMANLKSGLLKYKSDIGRFPSHSYNTTNVQVFRYDKVMSIESEDYNLLVTDNNVETSDIKNYTKRWKGPYMDSEISDFMYDSWGNPIWYIRYNYNLYLWSSGPDGEFYKEGSFYNADKAFEQQANQDNELCDDIVISVSKFKKPVPQSDSTSQTPPLYTGNSISGGNGGLNSGGNTNKPNVQSGRTGS